MRASPGGSPEALQVEEKDKAFQPPGDEPKKFNVGFRDLAAMQPWVKKGESLSGGVQKNYLSTARLEHEAIGIQGFNRGRQDSSPLASPTV